VDFVVQNYVPTIIFALNVSKKQKKPNPMKIHFRFVLKGGL
jgi:hypothetical protein